MGSCCFKFCGEHIFDHCCCTCCRLNCCASKEGCCNTCCPGIHFCANKCCPSGDPTVEEYFDQCKVQDKNRKCTDLGCLLLFLAWWAAWIMVSGIALSKGDPIQLLYGQDYQGAQCGIYDDDSSIKYPDHKNETRVVYPRMQEDLQEWIMSEDSLSDISNIDWLSLDWNILKNLNLTGVCVHDCPKLGEVVCTDYYRHEVGDVHKLNPLDVFKCKTDPVFRVMNRRLCENCWTIAIDTTDLFYRCLELIRTSTVKTESCIYPRGVPVTSNDCITVEQIVTATSIKPGYSNPLAEFLGAGVDSFNEVISDIINGVTVIWVSGIVVPLGLAFVYIVFLEMCAGCLVWTTIIVYFLAHAWLCFWLWMQAGVVDNDMLKHAGFESETDTQTVDSATRTTVKNFTNSQVDDDNADAMYTAAAIIASVVFVVMVCIIMSLLKKIRIAVAIIQQASKALRKMPTLLCYPCWGVALLVMLLTYFLVIGAYLTTMEHVDISSVANAAGIVNCTSSCDASFVDWKAVKDGCSASGKSCPVTTAGCPADCCDPQKNPTSFDTCTKTFMANYLKSITDKNILDCTAAQIDAEIHSTDWDCGVPFVGPNDDITTYMLWFHLFSFLWNMNFIEAIGICVVAGAVCDWYWTPPEANGSKKMTSWLPMWSSISRVYRFHLGSMAYGSAIVAVVQLLRIIMVYIDQKTKKLQEQKNPLGCLIRCLLCCVHCLLWCFEKCIKFITKNAYIYIAMRGYSFCKAARVSFFTFVHNMFQFAVTSMITTIFLVIGKILITVGVAVIAFSWIEYDDRYQEGGSDALHFKLLPVILAAMVAYFTGKMFLNVYHLAVDSILLCFCEDYKKNVEKGRPAFMTDGLRAAVIGGQALTREKIEDAIAKGATLEELKTHVSGIPLKRHADDSK